MYTSIQLPLHALNLEGMKSSWQWYTFIKHLLVYMFVVVNQFM